jgi:transcriptional regulator with XRE-family HTH domain
MSRPTGARQGRPWLITARTNHNLTREEAEYLVTRRSKRPLSKDQVDRETEARRMRRGLSQPDLSLLICCSQNEISKIETGERDRLNPRLVESIAKTFRISREEVLYGSPQSRTVKILGEMQGDEAIWPYSEAEHLAINGFTPDTDTDGYRVVVDSLEPRWRLGDILLYHNGSAPLEECIGRECVAEIEGRRYIGQIERGATPRLVTLKRLRTGNPTLIDKTPSWISPIIATYHKPPPGLAQLENVL